MFSDDVAREAGLAPGDRPAGEAGDAASRCSSPRRSCATSPVLAGACTLATLVLAVDVGPPARFFVKRVWLFVPIFTGIVVAPGDAQLHHARPDRRAPRHVVRPPAGLTRQGLDAAGLIVTRVAVSISLVVLLTLTTPWNRLLASLRSLFVPRMFVLVLGMTYRYVFHLLNGVTDMYTARKARTVTRDADVDEGPRVRRRDRRRALRQGARAVRRGAPGDGVAGLHGRGSHDPARAGFAAVDGAVGVVVRRRRVVAAIGGDRVLGR